MAANLRIAAPADYTTPQLPTVLSQAAISSSNPRKSLQFATKIEINIESFETDPQTRGVSVDPYKDKLHQARSGATRERQLQQAEERAQQQSWLELDDIGRSGAGGAGVASSTAEVESILADYTSAIIGWMEILLIKEVKKGYSGIFMDLARTYEHVLDDNTALVMKNFEPSFRGSGWNFYVSFQGSILNRISTTKTLKRKALFYGPRLAGSSSLPRYPSYHGLVAYSLPYKRFLRKRFSLEIKSIFLCYLEYLEREFPDIAMPIDPTILDLPPFTLEEQDSASTRLGKAASWARRKLHSAGARSN